MALIATATGYAGWSLRPLPALSPRPVARFFVSLLANEQFSSPLDRVVALSPNGTHLAYTANRKLYLRKFDRLEPVAIGETEQLGPDSIGPQRVFFSPDGQWVGFWQRGQLRKTPVTGGASIPLGASSPPGGPSWGSDGTIVYGLGSRGIWRVPASGGAHENIIKVDEGQLRVRPPDAAGRTQFCSRLRRASSGTTRRLSCNRSTPVPGTFSCVEGMRVMCRPAIWCTPRVAAYWRWDSIRIL